MRDKGSGKSKGFAFVKYEDQRSTVLAVDNFNGVKVCQSGRPLRASWPYLVVRCLLRIVSVCLAWYAETRRSARY